MDQDLFPEKPQWMMSLRYIPPQGNPQSPVCEVRLKTVTVSAVPVMAIDKRVDRQIS